MANWIYFDTRRAGAISRMLDGFFHILPEETSHKHHIHISCWCEPRVVWSEEAETCIVSHRRKGRCKKVICG